VDDSRVDEYMKAIRELQPGRRNRNAELLNAARAGDEASRRLVIESFLEITALLAIWYAPESLRVIDAIQEANVVLCALVDDTACPDPGVQLASAIKAHFEALGHRRPYGVGG
jgi:hypothetical protein